LFLLQDLAKVELVQQSISEKTERLKQIQIAIEIAEQKIQTDEISGRERDQLQVSLKQVRICNNLFVAKSSTSTHLRRS
jgi:transcriptional regulator of met regulon